MNNLYPTEQQRDQAIELGFDEVFTHELFKFFRDEHGLHGCIDLHGKPTRWFFRVDDIKTNEYVYHSFDEKLRFATHEEAESKCIDKLIEIVKNDNNKNRNLQERNQVLEAKILQWYIKSKDEDFAEHFDITTMRSGNTP